MTVAKIDAGTAHGDVLRLAASIGQAERDARIASRTAGDDARAAREAQYAAETRGREAERAAALEARKLRALLRALAHRTEAEPTTTTEPYGGPRVILAATFGEASYHCEASSGRWSSKPQPQIAEAFGWDRRPEAIDADGRSTGTTLYRSARGTSDPDKIETEREYARLAAEAFARNLTAPAYLRSLGIDPETAPDAAALVEARPLVMRKRDHWQGAPVTYWQVSWLPTLTASGEPIADMRVVSVHDLTEARAAAKARAEGREYAALDERNAEYEALRTPANETPEADVLAWAEALAGEALAVIVGRL